MNFRSYEALFWCAPAHNICRSWSCGCGSGQLWLKGILLFHMPYIIWQNFHSEIWAVNVAVLFYLITTHTTSPRKLSANENRDSCVIIVTSHTMKYCILEKISITSFCLSSRESSPFSTRSSASTVDALDIVVLSPLSTFEHLFNERMSSQPASPWLFSGILIHWDKFKILRRHSFASCLCVFVGVFCLTFSVLLVGLHITVWTQNTNIPSSVAVAHNQDSGLTRTRWLTKWRHYSMRFILCN